MQRNKERHKQEMMKKKNGYLLRESTILQADVMDTDLQRKFNAFRIRIQSREVLVNIQFNIRYCFHNYSGNFRRM